MNICLIRQDESAEEVNAVLGEVTLGRGPLLGCTDKRVSRQHALLKLSKEGDVILEAIHTNPFFYIKGEKAPVGVSKGDFVVINDGDEFSLVPDGYRFRVVIPSKVGSNESEHAETDNSTTEPQNIHVETDNNTTEPQSKHVETDNNTTEPQSKHVGTDNNTTEPQSKHAETDNSTTEPQSTGYNHKRHLPLWMINLAEDGENNSDTKSSSPQKRPGAIHENLVQKKVKLDQKTSDVSENGGSGNNDDPDLGVSEGKKEPKKSELLEMSGDEGGGESEEENVKAGSGESSTATQRGDTDTSGTHQGAAAGQRKRCIYGAGCYRKSTQHHARFSHPGDPDYSDKGLPECPYGTACYRKNKQHRLDFRHTMRPHRIRRPQDKQESNDDDEDYDYDDPFINDASSDDYQPTDIDSDISDEISSGYEESDSKRMMKEAKKFTKKK